jgi:cyanophycin synthetase
MQNAMAAAAAGHALGLTLGDIKMGLQTYHPTPGQLPGRTNLIEADGVRCPRRVPGAGATVGVHASLGS